MKNANKFSSLLVIMMMALSIVPAAFADTIGPSSGAIFSSVDFGSDADDSWLSPSNATTSNDKYSAVRITSSGPDSASYYLEATDFGFSIPVGATINGIEVKVEKSQFCTGPGFCTSDVVDNGIRMIKSGAIVGTNLTNSTIWPSVDTVFTYGGPTSLWGTTWTPAQINDITTGFAISARRTPGGDRTARVDQITMKVYYTPAVTDTTAPVITRLGSSPVSVEAGAAYVDAGATALDETDGDITASIVTTNDLDGNTPGSYTYHYNVMDAALNPAIEVTRTVTVTDVTPPVLTEPVDVSVEASGTLTVVALGSASATDNSDGIITITNDAPASFPVGNTTVTWTAKDPNLNTATATQNVEVVDSTDPVANAGPDLPAIEGGFIMLDGGSSYDSGSGLVSFSWDFGDGSPLGSGVATPHIFADNGVYTVTLTVTDAVGHTNSDAATITVSNVDPTADAHGPYSGTEEVPVSFVGSATDPGADTFTYAWDFGDGSFGAGATPSHAYADNGNYTAKLVVTDDDGGVSLEVTAAVEIFNAGPTVTTSVTPSAPGTDDPLICGAVPSDVAADTPTITAYQWSEDAVLLVGETSDTLAASSTSKGHTYTCEATAEDEDGGIGSDMDSVSVGNTNVVVDITAPDDSGSLEHIKGPTTVTWDATDADGDTMTFDVAVVGYGTVCDDITETSCEVDTALLGDGTKTVVVTADDGSASGGSDSAEFIADNTAPVITMVAPEPLTPIEKGSGVYLDLGASAVDAIDGVVSVSTEDDDLVDTDVIDDYDVTYTATDAAGNAAIAVRTVQVRDTTPPELWIAETRDIDSDGMIDAITLTFTEPINDSRLEVGTSDGWDVEGYDGEAISTGDTADDDKLLLSFTESGTFDTSVTPAVSYDDSFDFEASTHDFADNELETFGPSDDSEFVSADGAAPLILITGANPVNLDQGSPDYVDEGATVSDPADVDFAGLVTGGDEVDESALGSYFITYDVNDGNDNTAHAERTVNVNQVPAVPESPPSGGGGGGGRSSSGGFGPTTTTTPATTETTGTGGTGGNEGTTSEGTVGGTTSEGLIPTGAATTETGNQITGAATTETGSGGSFTWLWVLLGLLALGGLGYWGWKSWK